MFRSSYFYIHITRSFEVSIDAKVAEDYGAIVRRSVTGPIYDKNCKMVYI
jgi:hypothetical protein